MPSLQKRESVRRVGTYRAKIENRRDLLETDELLSGSAEGSLGGEVGCYRTDVAVEAESTELYIQKEWV
jgi:hypothetical protein